jgi:hypothetical protein
MFVSRIQRYLGKRSGRLRPSSASRDHGLELQTHPSAPTPIATILITTSAHSLRRFWKSCPLRQLHAPQPPFPSFAFDDTPRILYTASSSTVAHAVHHGASPALPAAQHVQPLRTSRWHWPHEPPADATTTAATSAAEHAAPRLRR